MARVRSDFEGGIWAHTVDEHGRAGIDQVWLVAGDEVPAGVAVSVEHLEPEGEGPKPAPPGPGEGGGSGPGEGAVVASFDPDEFTVDEVNDQLEKLDDDHARAVIEAERDKRARHGVLNGPTARRLAH